MEQLITQYVEDVEKTSALEVRRFEETLSHIIEAEGITLPQKMEPTKAMQEAQSLTPKRLFRGTFSEEAFRIALGEDKYEWYEKLRKKDQDFRKKTYEIFNFMDGTRTAYDIVKAISAEYSKTSLKDVMKFFRDLEATKFIAF